MPPKFEAHIFLRPPGDT